MASELEIVINKVSEDSWREFLERTPGAMIYHTPEWKRVLEKSFGYKPYYIFVRDETGKIVGMMPLFYVKNKLIIRKKRLCSAPFSHMCGPIGVRKNNVVDTLVRESIKLYLDLNADFIEIRDHIKKYGFQSQTPYFMYLLTLSSNVEEVWKKLKRDVRKGIKKAKKHNLIVESTWDLETLREFYELNCMTKKRIGVPCHPLKFFKNMLKFLEDYARLYIVKHEGTIIAGGIVLFYKDRALYGYSAADPQYLKLYPYNLFRWESIKDACSRGYKYFDFGRASYDNVGLREYKKRWGTVEIPLTYSYYPKNPKLITENRKSVLYKIGSSVIRKTPMPIYKRISAMIFGNFG